MRIGIITYWDTEDNYGQVLQCYALISYLKERGHVPFLIKTKQGDECKTSLLHKIETVFTLLLQPKKLVGLFRKPQPIYVANEMKKNRQFSEFKEKNIPSTEIIYSFSDLCNTRMDVDAIICGSDQVWSSISPLMYLQFPGKFLRIAYAVSFGGFRPINISDKRKVKQWMSSFDFISLREKEGIEICSMLGKKAYLVPDPTLIVNRDCYDNINVNITVTFDEPYILLYLLGNRMDYEIAPIYSLAKDKGLKVVYVASQGRNDMYEKSYPTVEQWLSLVSNASYIITNSFHGTVFSLIFNVPFLSLLLSGSASRMNSRITDLLERYNLSDRIFKGNYHSVFDEINFDCFNVKQKEDTAVVDKLLGEVLK